MNYSTPQASVNIRGGKVAIETNADVTIIDLLEGDILECFTNQVRSRVTG